VRTSGLHAPWTPFLKAQLGKVDQSVQMLFDLLPGDPSARFCYMQRAVLEALLADEAIIDELLEELEVPGKRLERLPKPEKIAAIQAQVEHFRNSKTSFWRSIDPNEILAAAIFRVVSEKKRLAAVLYSGVKRESDLLGPVSKWLATKGLDVYPEVPMGRKRIDVLGYKKGGFLSPPRLIGLELKNDLVQLQRGLDQMTTFSDYVQSVYLACTPYLAASYLLKHSDSRNVSQWDGDVLNRKLRSFGFGLLLVQGQDVHQVVEPRQVDVGTALLKEVEAELNGRLSA
jgi:hypothetical protein